MRRVLVIVSLLMLGCDARPRGSHVENGSVGKAAGGTQPAQQAPTFVVFADVTRSLTADEELSMTQHVQSIIEILPGGAHLYVFPLLEDVQRANVIFEGTLPEILMTSDAVTTDELRVDWQSQIGTALQTVLRGSPGGRDRTCISAALRKATEIVEDLEGGAEIVLVSDMLEDCSDSLLGGPLQLQKQSVKAELEAARALPQQPLLSLRQSSVTALLPTIPTSGQRVARPPVHELKAFWRAILDRCGDRAANYRFGTTLPRRLLDYKPSSRSAI